MEYPKINSLFKRDMSNNAKLIMGDYSSPEFGIIKQWHVQEKIDGTNIRIVYDPLAENGAKVSILGRSKDSAMPTHLFDYLTSYFTVERVEAALGESKGKCILYGEGYGGNIQTAGPYYRSTVGFILFDILILIQMLSYSKLFSE